MADRPLHTADAENSPTPKVSQIGTHHRLNTQVLQVVGPVIIMSERGEDQVQSTGSRGERQSHMASIWTEARLTRGNAVANATATNGKP